MNVYHTPPTAGIKNPSECITTMIELTMTQPEQNTWCILAMYMKLVEGDFSFSFLMMKLSRWSKTASEVEYLGHIFSNVD